ncbi:hypothetical protein FNF31_01890 [Cafeteria roenbergensis]|uniref:Amidohydrolase-related domain-containing protein n=1 Tax=Cafeteria roenbergensis TaxID=33653 RepID=A0A5A8DJD8_CAFRO|nr:hypothetical protein FNF31_01890 [Cafeteria roenbergensis]
MAAAAGAKAPALATLCDSHFHLWDTKATPNPNLGTVPSGFQTYLGARYASDLEPIRLAGCVHVETCVGQSDGGFRLDPFAETEFVHSQCAALGVPFKIVAFVNLSEPDAEVAVKKHLSRSPHVVGVRMITNFVDGHPEWTYPQVERDHWGGDEQFEAGLRMLAAYGLVFDLQAAPEQLSRAASVLAASVPAHLKVVVNHMGCGPRCAEDERAATGLWDVWLAGMTALAKRETTFVKLSGITMLFPGWETPGPVRTRAARAVKECVRLFGPERCMLGSNCPVDPMLGPAPATDVLAFIADVVSEAVGGDVASLEHAVVGTASAVYGLG